jgi:AraC-like DNA-binding protein
MAKSNSHAWQEKLAGMLQSPAVIFAQDMPWHTSRTISIHAHNFYQLDYFYKGSGKVVIGKSTYLVTPGDLFIANPGDRHGFLAAANRPMEGITFKFHLTKHGLLFPNLVANLGRLTQTQQAELEHYLRRACIEANKSPEENRQVAASFFSLFFHLLPVYLRDYERIAGAHSKLDSVQRVLEYINLHYNQPLTLPDLGRVAGLNPKYLCHRFTVTMGYSPIAGLTRKRMEVAQTLLGRTRLAIHEVAIRTGYPDLFHFSKRFKEIVGISPKNYRQTFKE